LFVSNVVGTNDSALNSFSIQHSEQCTHHTYDMLTHHRTTHNNSFFYQILAKI